MQIIQNKVWKFYMEDDCKLDHYKMGKWMYFFKDKILADKLCENAVKQDIVKEAKYKKDETGVACFYLNCDDKEGHKKILKYFLENNLIQRTKVGKLYNISFKFDTQTLKGEYGESFQAKITLSMFLDLETEEWIP